MKRPIGDVNAFLVMKIPLLPIAEALLYVPVCILVFLTSMHARMKLSKVISTVVGSPLIHVAVSTSFSLSSLKAEKINGPVLVATVSERSRTIADAFIVSTFASEMSRMLELSISGISSVRLRSMAMSSSSLSIGSLNKYCDSDRALARQRDFLRSSDIYHRKRESKCVVQQP